MPNAVALLIALCKNKAYSLLQIKYVLLCSLQEEEVDCTFCALAELQTISLQFLNYVLIAHEEVQASKQTIVRQPWKPFLASAAPSISTRKNLLCFTHKRVAKNEPSCTNAFHEPP